MSHLLSSKTVAKRASAQMPHIPVMQAEVLSALQPKDGAHYIDATFGAGGYSRAILSAANCSLCAIDRDPATATYAASLATQYGDRFCFYQGCFSAMEQYCTPPDKVDGIVMDLGVSSMQLDDAQRGFSFRFDGPLDMRMGDMRTGDMRTGDMRTGDMRTGDMRTGDMRTGHPYAGENIRTAADMVNTMDEEELADIIYHYGEERHARQVARAIIHARAKTPITTTGQFAAIVRTVVRKGNGTIDPATRTFQAIRIALNDELGELEQALVAAERLLYTGGRLVVVAFHSLEDRIVKQFMQARVQATTSRLLPGETPPPQATLALLQRKVQVPDAAECARNPRARSARLRVCVRTDAPAPL